LKTDAVTVTPRGYPKASAGFTYLVHHPLGLNSAGRSQGAEVGDRVVAVREEDLDDGGAFGEFDVVGNSRW